MSTAVAWKEEVEEQYLGRDWNGGVSDADRARVVIRVDRQVSRVAAAGCFSKGASNTNDDDQHGVAPGTAPS